MSSNIEIERVCQYCKKIFIAKTTKTRYCSHACNRKAYKENIWKQKIDVSDNEMQSKVLRTIKDLSAKEFLSVKEGAQLIGCSKQTFYSLINSGRIKAVNLKIKKTIVKRSEIDKLFN